MKKQLVKTGKKIDGFVYQKTDGSWWYAFGRPSQRSYAEFSCHSLQHGIKSIEMYKDIKI